MAAVMHFIQSMKLLYAGLG